MQQRYIILDGPNLNRLGRREPSIYGVVSSQEMMERLQHDFPNVTIEYHQSNHEGVLIDLLQQFDDEKVSGIIFNAGAYTHTSLALADAIRSLSTPVIEVHLSNTAAREEYRHTSYIAPVVRGTITGFGITSYRLALLAFLEG
ncbi:type II 3-dehydroquinate dehydratase [Porphyromonas endodontalis]|uniref:type II 3-dehydroquinate dehydratase n=1 Tax=Porphyromonas endodontalis TaxID=28124 RepID=UPI0023F52166|nr:type II 3-dehydroquinate dehydratase [Porphyromonas endodontalis]